MFQNIFQYFQNNFPGLETSLRGQRGRGGGQQGQNRRGSRPAQTQFHAVSSRSCLGARVGILDHVVTGD